MPQLLGAGCTVPIASLPHHAPEPPEPPFALPEKSCLCNFCRSLCLHACQEELLFLFLLPVSNCHSLPSLPPAPLALLLSTPTSPFLCQVRFKGLFGLGK